MKIGPGFRREQHFDCEVMTTTGGDALSAEDVEVLARVKQQNYWREQQKEAEKRKATSVREEQRRLQDMERIRRRAFAEQVVEAEAGGDGAMYVQIGSGLRRQIPGRYWCQLCERSLSQNNLEMHIMSREHQRLVESSIGWGGWSTRPTPAKQQAMPPAPQTPQARPSQTPPPKQPMVAPQVAAPSFGASHATAQAAAPPFTDPRQAPQQPVAAPSVGTPHATAQAAAPPFRQAPQQPVAARAPQAAAPPCVDLRQAEVAPPPPEPWPSRAQTHLVHASAWQTVGFDGTVRCDLCRKVADENHLCSSEHKKRMEYFCHQEQNRTNGFEPPELEYLAWVPLIPDDVTGERQLKCLLCDKWVNDPWYHCGTRENPAGSKDHQRYLQHVGGAWYNANVLPKRRRWHPPSGPQRRPLQAVPAMAQAPSATYSQAAPSAPRPARPQPAQLLHADPAEEGLVEEC